MMRRAGLVLALCAATAIGLAARSGAATPELLRAPPLIHPLIPSTRAISKDLLREDGIPQPSMPIDTTAPGLVREGQSLYDVHCISCHGAGLGGTKNGPSLLDAGGAGAAFYVETGQMPLFAPGFHQAELGHDFFDQRQTDALVAYVSAHSRRTIPLPQVAVNNALLTRGAQLFEDNCQACHGAAAQGAIVGDGWIAPPLSRATLTEIGEAVRIGPGEMPAFSTAQLSENDLDAVATYVRYVTRQEPNPGGSPFDYLGPVVEGAIGWGIGIGGLFGVIYFTGTTAQGARLSRRR